MTRRHLIAGSIAVSALQARRAMWKPKVGILVNYSEGNVSFARQEGFTSIGFWAQMNGNLARPSEALIPRIHEVVKNSGLVCSVLGVTANHIDPDRAIRRAVNDHTAAVIAIAGQVGVPFLGTMSGKDPSKNLAANVDEIRRIHEERYFPLCEKHKVRLVCEPWPEGPNVATGPMGYEALCKAFGNSIWVGIQFDASHFVRQFMDPYQIAREWIDRIFDVHLKDTEVRYQVLQRSGINPPAPAPWWRYRIPGAGAARLAQA